MAKHLTEKDIDAIVNCIVGWGEEKLTWEALCSTVEPFVGKIPTRQSLYAISRVRDAFKSRKASGKAVIAHNPRPASLEIAAQRIERLQNEMDFLKKQNDALLEQFVKWQYNAFKYNVSERQLNEDMPRIDRGRTVFKKNGKLVK
jgi:hypothetical protein